MIEKLISWVFIATLPYDAYCQSYKGTPIHSISPLGLDDRFGPSSHEDLKNADALKVQLQNDGPIMVFNHVDALGTAHWYGEAESAQMNLLSNEIDGQQVIFGSIVDEVNDEVHRISTNSDGEVVFLSIPATSFPEELEPLQNPFSPSEVNIFANSTSPPETEPPVEEPEDSIIDVMIVWTKNAECKNSGLYAGCEVTTTTYYNMISLAVLAIEETNTAYLLSGIHAQLRLVFAHRHPVYTEDSNYAFSHALYSMTDPNDPILGDIHLLRAQYKADVVAMLIDDFMYCGLGWMPPTPNPESMFSVSSWACATGYFSFGHEIAHNLGCHHDQGTADGCTSSDYNYGYRDPDANFRSIMGYNCRMDQCDKVKGSGCARVQRFSNTKYLFNDKPIGHETANNARRMNAVVADVAGFY